MSSEKFLGLLDKNAKEFLFSAFDYRREMYPVEGITDINELEALNKKGYCIYVTVNKMKGGRLKENVQRVRAIWVDDDNPRRKPRKKFPLPPSIIVQTSAHKVGKVTKYKYQYLWLTRTKNFDEFEHVMQTMVDEHGNDKGVKDLARVLRLPGYNHMKDKNNPHAVKIVGGSEKRHSWEKIKIAFPPAKHKKSSTKVEGKYDKRKAKGAIATGDDYHGSLRDRAMELANKLGDADDIVAILRSDMERVPVEDRDKRWEARYSDEHLFECANSAVNKIEAEEDSIKPLKKVTKKNSKTMPVIPTELIFPNDEYGDFIKNVMESTEHRNNPVASMVHGRSIIAFACDGYGAIGNVTPSGFDVLLGDSMKGKTLTAKAAKRFLPEDSLKRVISSFTNGEALENKFIETQEKYKRPSVFASIDEIGMNLNSIKNNSSSSSITHRLLEIATNGLDPLSTRFLVSQSSVILYSPRLVTCGNTTVAALKGAIKRQEVETGATSRQRFFHAGQNVTNKRKSEIKKRKKKHVEQLKNIMLHSKISQVKNRGTEYKEVIIEDDVDSWIYDNDKELLKNGKDNTLRGRHTELALSWAIPRAVFIDYKKPVITMELFEWAYKIIDYSIQTIEYLYDVHLGDDNENVEAERKLIKRLEDNKCEMRKSDALNFRPYSQWDSRKKNDFIFQLERAGIIEIIKGKSSANQNKLIMRLIGE